MTIGPFGAREIPGRALSGRTSGKTRHGHTAGMADEKPDRAETARAKRSQSTPLPASREPTRHHVPADVRDASFHTALRGYARVEVDRYVERVNGLIAELEISRSPESAVRNALDRVGEQTGGILQQAGETANEITQTARAEAEATVDGARSEAEQIVTGAKEEAKRLVDRANAQAEKRRVQEEERIETRRREAEDEMGALRADTDAIAAERRQLLEEIEQLAERLRDLADSATPNDDPESPAGGDEADPDVASEEGGSDSSPMAG